MIGLHLVMVCNDCQLLGTGQLPTIEVLGYMIPCYVNFRSRLTLQKRVQYEVIHRKKVVYVNSKVRNNCNNSIFLL